MDKLKELRLKNRLSQKEMANILNLPQQTYSNYEKGKTEMSFSKLVEIADYFYVTTDYLLNRTLLEDVVNLKFLTPVQQRLIKTIINSDDNVCQKMEAFFTGYSSGREHQLQDLINLSRGFQS